MRRALGVGSLCPPLIAALLGCGGGEAFVGPRVDAPFAGLSAGVLHTCGVTATGQVFCWGWNRDGQLGDGSRSDRAVPVRVDSPVRFAAVTAGGGHTCGVATDGNAYCWGFNLSGQLGDGTQDSRLRPVRVVGARTYTSLDAGGAFTCGAGTDSAAYCWGWGAAGQLGGIAPEGCLTATGTDPCARTPMAVSGGLRLVEVAAGVRHGCGLAADSTAWCWGENGSGELGDSVVADTAAPVPVLGGHRFVAITVGFEHSCGLAPDGEAYCWGSNTLGQLGDTSVGSSALPRLVLGGITFSSLSAGATHSCGVSVLGVAYCWGSNASGQLGTDESPASCAVAGGDVVGCARRPVAVEGALSFTLLASGTHHTCGLTTSQVAYCWGLNDRGQLGDGTRRGSALPVRVANQDAVP
ncbi:MAG TPA: hypothetical protein VNI61_01780 [Gemmatimonadales bacterium]|nr:hypothetical protein [Gemmatimonadales bacterium]